MGENCTLAGGERVSDGWGGKDNNCCNECFFSQRGIWLLHIKRQLRSRILKPGTQRGQAHPTNVRAVPLQSCQHVGRLFACLFGEPRAGLCRPRGGGKSPLTPAAQCLRAYMLPELVGSCDGNSCSLPFAWLGKEPMCPCGSCFDPKQDSIASQLFPIKVHEAVIPKPHPALNPKRKL